MSFKKINSSRLIFLNARLDAKGSAMRVIIYFTCEQKPRIPAVHKVKVKPTVYSVKKSEMQIIKHPNSIQAWSGGHHNQSLRDEEQATLTQTELPLGE